MTTCRPASVLLLIYASNDIVRSFPEVNEKYIKNDDLAELRITSEWLDLLFIENLLYMEDFF